MDLTQALEKAANNTEDTDPVRKEAMDRLALEVTLLKEQLKEAVYRLRDNGLEP